jgi:hypothetical protein
MPLTATSIACPLSTADLPDLRYHLLSSPTSERELNRMDRPDAVEPPPAAGSDSTPRVVVVRRSARAQTPLALILGLLLVAFSVFLLRNDGPLLLAGTRTQGQLMSYQQAASKSGRYVLHPWVRFKDAANQEHQFLDAVRASGRLSPNGGPIGVIYDPAQPQHAIVDRGLWKESVLAVPGALGLTLIAQAFVLRRRPKAHLP